MDGSSLYRFWCSWWRTPVCFQRQKRLRTCLTGRRMFKWIVFMQNLVQTVRSMDSQATSKHAFDTILETMAGETERRFNSIMDEVFTAPKFKSTLTSLWSWIMKRRKEPEFSVCSNNIRVRIQRLPVRIGPSGSSITNSCMKPVIRNNSNPVVHLLHNHDY